MWFAVAIRLSTPPSWWTPQQPGGIRINAICPGTIETAMVADMDARGELTGPQSQPRHRSAAARRSPHPSSGCAAREPVSSSESHSHRRRLHRPMTRRGKDEKGRAAAP